MNRLSTTKRNTSSMNTTNNRTVANKLNIKPNRPNIMTNILRNINLFMTNKVFRKVTNMAANRPRRNNTNKVNSSISKSVSNQACLVSSSFYHVIRLSQACHHCIRSFTLFVYEHKSHVQYFVTHPFAP